MHKIFGTKENASYSDREGAYIIVIKENRKGKTSNVLESLFKIKEIELSLLLFNSNSLVFANPCFGILYLLPFNKYSLL